MTVTQRSCWINWRIPRFGSALQRLAIGSVSFGTLRAWQQWCCLARAPIPRSQGTSSVPPAPAEHRGKAASPAFCPATVQAYAALLQAHESASILGEPLLTQAGLVYLRDRLLPAALTEAESTGTRATPVANGALLPSWDTENRRLWLGTSLVKEFRQPAPNQTTLLEVFQEQGWARRIDDPLGLAAGEVEKDAKRRLHETI